MLKCVVLFNAAGTHLILWIISRSNRVRTANTFTIYNQRLWLLKCCCEMLRNQVEEKVWPNVSLKHTNFDFYCYYRLCFHFLCDLQGTSLFLSFYGLHPPPPPHHLFMWGTLLQFYPQISPEVLLLFLSIGWRTNVWIWSQALIEYSVLFRPLETNKTDFWAFYIENIHLCGSIEVLCFLGFFPPSWFKQAHHCQL